MHTTDEVCFSKQRDHRLPGAGQTQLSSPQGNGENQHVFTSAVCENAGG